jgi:two-component system chemotaxis response regulator CheY
MSINVLIVDDSATIRSMIRKVVELSIVEGVEVVEAENGISALARLTDHHIDVILTDINMPRMNGSQLIAKIKSSPKMSHIPVIVVSTDGSAERMQELEKQGILGYLRKPFRPEQLRELLSNIVEVNHDSQPVGTGGSDF